jgi:serpin B
MRDAFDRRKADFTGIANPPDPADRLVISRVFHKAFV